MIGTPTGEDQIEDTSFTQNVILKWIPKRQSGKLYNVFIRRKTGTTVELLQTRQATIGFYKWLNINWPLRELLEFQVGVFSNDV